MSHFAYALGARIVARSGQPPTGEPPGPPSEPDEEQTRRLVRLLSAMGRGLRRTIVGRRRNPKPAGHHRPAVWPKL